MRTVRRRLEIRFTLIELLVVVSIISILAAMLLPALARSRKLAKRTTCIGNFKQMAAGFTFYTDDFDGLLPRRGNYLWYAANYGSNGSTWHYPRNAYSILWAIEEYEFGPSTKHPEVGNPALNAPGNFWDPDTMTLQLRQGNNICPYSFLWAWPQSAAPGAPAPMRLSRGGQNRLMMTDFTLDAPAQGFVCYEQPKDQPQDLLVATDFGANYNASYMFFQDNHQTAGGRGMAACAGQVAAFNDGHVSWYATSDLISWPAFNGDMLVPEGSVYGAE